MRNRIPYALLLVLILGKISVWWLLFWGTDYSRVEPTLMGVFEPVHQFSYLVLSSFLVVGVLFKSRFALIAMFAAFIINIAIFVYRGSTVYQSVLDPVILIILCLILYYRKPNSWFGGTSANKQRQGDA